MPVYDITFRTSPAENISCTVRAEDTAVLREAVTVLRGDLARHKRGMNHAKAEKCAPRLLALDLLNDVGNLIVGEIQRRESGERSA
jgi:hypothetical protein